MSKKVDTHEKCIGGIAKLTFKFSKEIFKYYYYHILNLDVLRQFPLNPSVKRIVDFYPTLRLTFKDYFDFVVANFPFFCGSDKVHVEYMVNFCLAFPHGDLYHSFFVSCALLLHLVSACQDRCCHRLLKTAPFATSLVMKRILLASAVCDSSGVDRWLKNLMTRPFDQLESISVFIKLKIRKNLGYLKKTYDCDKHSHETKLNVREMKHLAEICVPNLSIEDYQNFSYNTCTNCHSKCLVYYRMVLAELITD